MSIYPAIIKGLARNYRMIMSAFMLATIVFFSFALNTMAGSNSKNLDAAELYRKHCSACHPDAGMLRETKDILRAMTSPPPFMPSFGEEKISQNNAKKIAEYIHPR